MSTVFDWGRTFLDNSGNVLSSGSATFYIAGSTVTKIAIYPTAADQAAGTNALSNPQTLNSAGRLPQQVHSAGPCRVIIKDSVGATIYDEDNVVTTDYSGLTRAVAGAIIWPQTTAESAASVTPTYCYFPPGDIRRYGADMTGVADSYSAVNKACSQAYQTNGAAVFVPEGTAYCSSSRLAIDNATGITIYGEGRRSILKFNSSLTTIPVLVQRTGLTECKGMVIRDLSIDANGGGQLSGGIIQFNGCTDFICSNVTILNATKVSGTNGVDGIACSNGGGSVACSGVIENCFLDGVAKAALYVAAGSSGVRIAKNHVTNTVGAGTGNGVGILVDNASHVEIINNQLYTTEAQGILITDTSGAVSDVLIQGNTLKSCGSITTTVGSGDGIMVSSVGTGMIRININGNLVQTSGTATNAGSGIECNTATDVVIANNLVRDSAYDGIRLQACLHTSVTGNRCTANNRAAISFAGGIQLLGACSHVSIKGNHCSDSSGTTPQSYGLIFSSGCALTEVTVEGNHLSGNKTLGNPFLCQGNIVSGYIRIVGRTQETNTATDIAKFFLANGSTASLHAKVTGSITSTGTDAALYTREALFKTAAGATTQVGATTTLGTDLESDATWTGATMDATSNACRVRVQGKAATVVDWYADTTLTVVA